MKYYTGIGSRETPDNVLSEMCRYAQRLSRLDYILRSGAADGADTSFEYGAAVDKKEIYLPWKSFNAESYERTFQGKLNPQFQPSPLFLDALPEKIQREARELAESFHPHWRQLTIGGKKLHTRNVLQILGQDMMAPSQFVICWTKDGKTSGGTGQALRIAYDQDIPIYNLFNVLDKEMLMAKIEQEETQARAKK